MNTAQVAPRQLDLAKTAGYAALKRVFPSGRIKMHSASGFEVFGLPPLTEPGNCVVRTKTAWADPKAVRCDQYLVVCDGQKLTFSLRTVAKGGKHVDQAFGMNLTALEQAIPGSAMLVDGLHEERSYAQAN